MPACGDDSATGFDRLSAWLLGLTKRWITGPLTSQSSLQHELPGMTRVVDLPTRSGAHVAEFHRQVAHGKSGTAGPDG